MKKLLSILLIAGFGGVASAQVSFTGEVRPRSEYARGFKTLANANTEAGMFTTQRTRLNLAYKSDAYTAKVVLQDIRTWGGQSQLVMADGLFSLHEGWFDWKVKGDWSLKAGRQELVYDDHRIFGHVGWAQQARSHDAAVIKFKNKLHIGLAYNDNPGAGLTRNYYTVAKSYKAFQYLWYHMDSKDGKFGASLLALNNGKPNQTTDSTGAITGETIEYSQTVGGRLTGKFSDKLSASSNIYYQGGLDGSGNTLNAFLVNLDLNYKLSDKTKLTVGFERQSGNSEINQAAGENNAFNPFYGTNHKFNGLMDYFYVGNHANSVGLQDNYLKVVQKLGEKNKLIVAAHNFSAVGAIADANNAEAAAGLGNELDIVFVRNVSKDINLKAGYSQLLATESMELLKNGGDATSMQNWVWVMLTFKPKFM